MDGQKYDWQNIFYIFLNIFNIADGDCKNLFWEKMTKVAQKMKLTLLGDALISLVHYMCTYRKNPKQTHEWFFE